MHCLAKSFSNNSSLGKLWRRKFNVPEAAVNCGHPGLSYLVAKCAVAWWTAVCDRPSEISLHQLGFSLSEKEATAQWRFRY